MIDTTQPSTTLASAPRRNPKSGVGQAAISRLLPTWLNVVVLVVLGLIVVLPLIYLLLASLNSGIGVAAGEIIPSTVHADNYLKVWTTVSLARGLVNSIIVSLAVAVASAILSIGTAYVLVRFAFLGRVTILRALFGLQSIPGTMLVLPVFMVFSSATTYLSIPVVGTRWGLFLTYITFALPFSSWVMVTYVRGLPVELEEAARIDGASNLGILLRVIMPLSWPGMVVSALFAFLLGWNDVLFAVVMTNPQTQTVAVALQRFAATSFGGAIPPYGQMMAAALICAVPVVVLYLIFQRYLVSGLTAGSSK